jgi:hypothetical protein
MEEILLSPRGGGTNRGTLIWQAITFFIFFLIPQKNTRRAKMKERQKEE